MAVCVAYIIALIICSAHAHSVHSPRGCALSWVRSLCVCSSVCVCGFVSSYQLGNLMDCAASLYGRLYVHKYVCHKNRAYKAVNTHTDKHTHSCSACQTACRSIGKFAIFSREKSNNKRVISAIIVIACESINEISISISFSLSHFNWNVPRTSQIESKENARLIDIKYTSSWLCVGGARLRN